jgi:DUF971 family protein
MIVTDIKVDNTAALLTFQWSDGTASELSVGYLRSFCPCAVCQRYDPVKKAVSHQAKSIVKIEPCGRYGLIFYFSDSHKTGIYSWSYLKELAST